MYSACQVRDSHGLSENGLFILGRTSANNVCLLTYVSRSLSSIQDIRPYVCSMGFASRLKL